MAVIGVSRKRTGMPRFLLGVEDRLGDVVSSALETPYPDSPEGMLEAVLKAASSLWRDRFASVRKWSVSGSGSPELPPPPPLDLDERHPADQPADPLGRRLGAEAMLVDPAQMAPAANGGHVGVLVAPAPRPEPQVVRRHVSP